MEIKEVSIDDIDYMNQIVELEKLTFGRFGGVDLWILKPLVKFGKVFIILEAGKVIGAAEFMIAFDSLDGFLYGFSIKKQFQNQGLGRKFLIYCEKYFSKKHVKSISLTVDPNNTKGINLYKSLGYRIESLEKNEYEKGIDRYRMIKEL